MPIRKDVSFTVEELAAVVNGRVVNGQVVNSSKVKITALAPLGVSSAQPAISFLQNSKGLSSLTSAPPAALLIDQRTLDKANQRQIDLKKIALIIVNNPQLALIKLVPEFYQSTVPPPGISPLAAIDPSAEIGDNCFVGPFVTIGPFVKIGPRSTIHSHVVIYQGVTIGADVTVHAGAVIREDCEIGNRCTILSGAVIGSEGFGYLPDENGRLVSVPQVGGLKLGDDVDIGANSCIDRAALGETVIGRGSKIDNLVQIGHNVQLGRSVIVCGQAGIAGSSKIADGVVIGGGAGIADHCEIASGVRIGAASGVTAPILEPGDYAGYPAMPIQQWRKIYGQLRRQSRTRRSNGAPFKEDDDCQS